MDCAVWIICFNISFIKEIRQHREYKLIFVKCALMEKKITFSTFCTFTWCLWSTKSEKCSFQGQIAQTVQTIKRRNSEDPQRRFNPSCSQGSSSLNGTKADLWFKILPFKQLHCWLVVHSLLESCWCGAEWNFHAFRLSQRICDAFWRVQGF